MRPLKSKFTHVVRCIDQELQLTCALQVTENYDIKEIHAVVITDQHGGHRHEWRVSVNAKEILRTESLSEAIRVYNELNEG